MIYPTGQTHLNGKVITNVRVSWLPTELSAGNCSNCLDVKMLSSTNPPVITYEYIRGTSYSFSITFDFKREPISDFKYSVRLNPNLQQNYFSGIDISYTATVNVTPSVLALMDDTQTLSLDSVDAIAADNSNNSTTSTNNR
jgi:hypothetical protein